MAMNCPNCGTENTPGAAFCGNCGTANPSPIGAPGVNAGSSRPSASKRARPARATPSTWVKAPRTSTFPPAASSAPCSAAIKPGSGPTGALKPPAADRRLKPVRSGAPAVD